MIDLRTEEEKWRSAVVSDFKYILERQRILAYGTLISLILNALTLICVAVK